MNYKVSKQIEAVTFLFRRKLLRSRTERGKRGNLQTLMGKEAAVVFIQAPNERLETLKNAGNQKMSRL